MLDPRPGVSSKETFGVESPDGSSSSSIAFANSDLYLLLVLGLVSGDGGLSEACRGDLLGTGRFAEDLDGTISLGVATTRPNLSSAIAKADCMSSGVVMSSLTAW